MIGKVTTSTLQGVLEIILDDDGSIQCANPRLKQWLELKQELYDRHYSPASGPYGGGFLNDIAEILKGKAEFEEKEMPEGPVVY